MNFDVLLSAQDSIRIQISRSLGEPEMCIIISCTTESTVRRVSYSAATATEDPIKCQRSQEIILIMQRDAQDAGTTIVGRDERTIARSHYLACNAHESSTYIFYYFEYRIIRTKTPFAHIYLWNFSLREHRQPNVMTMGKVKLA